MTSAPKATQTYAGIVVRRSRELVSFRKHAAGKMYASAVADTPPVISSVTPRSHVMSDTVGRQAGELSLGGKGRGQILYAPNMAETRITVVKKICRCILKASWEKKNCSITCTGATCVIRIYKNGKRKDIYLLPHDIRKALAGVW